MDRLAGFCQQLQSNETIRKNFQTGRTDTVIKDKLLGLSREIHTLDTTQRGKAFAALCGNPQG